MIGLVLAGIVVLLLVILGFVYRGQLLTALDLADDVTGSRPLTIVCLAFCLFMIVCLIFWMLLPIILYLGLRDLNRRAANLDQSMRLCADYLAQLRNDQAVPRENSPTEEKSTGNESS